MIHDNKKLSPAKECSSALLRLIDELYFRIAAHGVMRYANQY